MFIHYLGRPALSGARPPDSTCEEGGSLTTLLRRLRTGLLASAVMTAIAVTSDSSVTTAAAAQPQSTRFVAHLDIAKGQRPENITLEPDGSAVVTFAYSRQIARITTDGKVRILATLPAPAAGSTTPALSQPFLGGIVRADDGTLYFLYATGSSDLTGVWRLRADGTPQRIAALPAGGPSPNGLALDRSAHRLYVADSVLGTIWSVPHRRRPHPCGVPAPNWPRPDSLGANSIKVLRDLCGSQLGPGHHAAHPGHPAERRRAHRDPRDGTGQY
ncbi:hypothetical protein [Streptomyces sp. KL116D]|uniref:hypothetical protein n=1 Tax=Streptomyces sp. KL116D TaxID=3045152 RepID=UPI00355804E0